FALLEAIVLGDGSSKEAMVEVMGVEPTTSSMRPKRSSQLSYTPGATEISARPIALGQSCPPLSARGAALRGQHRRLRLVLGKVGDAVGGALHPAHLDGEGEVPDQRHVDHEVHDEHGATERQHPEQGEQCCRTETDDDLLATLRS